MRIAWAAALLVLEFLGLSLLVDLPTEGEALQVVAAARILAPVLLGAGAAGVLIARSGIPAAGGIRAPPPPARVWPALAAHLVAYAVTATLAVRLFGEGAPPPTQRQFLGWAASAALCVLLAAPLVASPRSLLGVALRNGWMPVLAVGGGILSWRALVAAEGLWGVLQSATLHVVAALLRAVAGEVRVDGANAIIGVGAFQVAVAPECSGADGLGLVLVFLAVWLSLARSRIRVARAAAILVPLGVVAAFVANVLRISTLLLIGASGRETLALGGFHSKLGWLLFVAIAFALMAAAERIPGLQLGPREQVGAGGVPPEAATHVTPLLAALASALVTSIWAEGSFDRWYFVRVVASVTALLALRRSLPRPGLRLASLPVVLGAAIAAVWVWWPGSRETTLGPSLEALEPSARLLWVATRLVGAVVVIPIIEELAFRGFLLPWLAGASTGSGPRAWPWGAIAASSLAFGAIHDRWLLGAAAGVAFAAARLWRGRLGDAVVAHAVANLGVAIAALAFGRFDLWG